MVVPAIRKGSGRVKGSRENDEGGGGKCVVFKERGGAERVSSGRLKRERKMLDSPADRGRRCDGGVIRWHVTGAGRPAGGGFGDVPSTGPDCVYRF